MTQTPSLFRSALARENLGRPPVWLMRQAGRYHAHYQALRKRYSFVELCKLPEVACEATMGPIRDFDFDAAILFSDLLFPLETMGMGLEYNEGPKLAWQLKANQDLDRLRGGASLARELDFQAEAMRLIRKSLSPEKGLLGFVGGPMTLFFYAVEGTHQGALASAKAGLTDGRFAGFCDKLLDLLAANMALQAQAGADTVAVLDTCAGEVDAMTYGEIVVPAIRALMEKFRALAPTTPISYYSKKTGPAHWERLRDLPIACMGVDWNHDLADVLSKFGPTRGIQGNIDPNWLFLEPKELERRLREVWNKVKALPADTRRGWVAGLGHGVLPKTPEDNIRLYMRVQKEVFGA